MPISNGYYYPSQNEIVKQPDIADMYGQMMALKQAREDRAIKQAAEQRQAEMDTMKLQNMREETKKQTAYQKTMAKLIDAYKSGQSAPMDVSKGSQTSLAAMQAAGFPGTSGFGVPQMGGGQGGAGQFAGPLGGVLGMPGMIPTTVQAPAQGMTDQDLMKQMALASAEAGDPDKMSTLLGAMQKANQSPEDKMIQLQEAARLKERAIILHNNLQAEREALARAGRNTTAIDERIFKAKLLSQAGEQRMQQIRLSGDISGSNQLNLADTQLENALTLEEQKAGSALGQTEALYDRKDQLQNAKGVLAKEIASGKYTQDQLKVLQAQQFKMEDEDRLLDDHITLAKVQSGLAYERATPQHIVGADGKVYQIGTNAQNGAIRPMMVAGGAPPAVRGATPPIAPANNGVGQTFTAGTEVPQPDQATMNTDSVPIGTDGRPMPSVQVAPPILKFSQTSTNVPGKEGGVGTVTEPTATGTPPLGAPPVAPVNAPGSQFTGTPGGTGNAMRWQLNPQSLRRDRNLFYQSKANRDLQEAQRARNKVIEHMAGYKAAQAAGDPAAISELGVLMDTIQGLNKGKISDSEMAEFMGLQTKWQQLQNWQSSFASQDEALKKLAPEIVKSLDKFSQDTYRADIRSWKSAKEQYNDLNTPNYRAANLLSPAEEMIPDLPESYNMDAPVTSAAPVSAPPAGVPPTAVSGFSKALNMKVWYDKASNAFYDASGKVVKSGQ